MDVEDVYEDLPVAPDLYEEIEKLKEENSKLSEIIKSLESDVDKLCAKIVEMKKIQDNLSKNISELFKTAKAEIERKDRTISELRSQVDDFLQHRNLGFVKKHNRDNSPANRSRENSPLNRKRENSPLNRHSSDPISKKMRYDSDTQVKPHFSQHMMEGNRSRSGSRDRYYSNRERNCVNTMRGRDEKYSYRQQHYDSKYNIHFRDNKNMERNYNVVSNVQRKESNVRDYNIKKVKNENEKELKSNSKNEDKEVIIINEKDVKCESLDSKPVENTSTVKKERNQEIKEIPSTKEVKITDDQILKETLIDLDEISNDSLKDVSISEDVEKKINSFVINVQTTEINKKKLVAKEKIKVEKKKAIKQSPKQIKTEMKSVKNRKIKDVTTKLFERLEEQEKEDQKKVTCSVNVAVFNKLAQNKIEDTKSGNMGFFKKNEGRKATDEDTSEDKEDENKDKTDVQQNSKPMEVDKMKDKEVKMRVEDSKNICLGFIKKDKDRKSIDEVIKNDKESENKDKTNIQQNSKPLEVDKMKDKEEDRDKMRVQESKNINLGFIQKDKDRKSIDQVTKKNRENENKDKTNIQQHSKPLEVNKMKDKEEDRDKMKVEKSRNINLFIKKDKDRKSIDEVTKKDKEIENKDKTNIQEVDKMNDKEEDRVKMRVEESKNINFFIKKDEENENKDKTNIQEHSKPLEVDKMNDKEEDRVKMRVEESKNINLFIKKDKDRKSIDEVIKKDKENEIKDKPNIQQNSKSLEVDKMKDKEEDKVKMRVVEETKDEEKNILEKTDDLKKIKDKIHAVKQRKIRDHVKKDNKIKDKIKKSITKIKVTGKEDKLNKILLQGSQESVKDIDTDKLKTDEKDIFETSDTNIKKIETKNICAKDVIKLEKEKVAKDKGIVSDKINLLLEEDINDPIKISNENDTSEIHDVNNKKVENKSDILQEKLPNVKDISETVDTDKNKTDEKLLNDEDKKETIQEVSANISKHNDNIDKDICQTANENVKDNKDTFPEEISNVKITFETVDKDEIDNKKTNNEKDNKNKDRVKELIELSNEKDAKKIIDKSDDKMPTLVKENKEDTVSLVNDKFDKEGKKLQHEKDLEIFDNDKKEVENKTADINKQLIKNEEESCNLKKLPNEMLNKDKDKVDIKVNSEQPTKVKDDEKCILLQDESNNNKEVTKLTCEKLDKNKKRIENKIDTLIKDELTKTPKQKDKDIKVTAKKVKDLDKDEKKSESKSGTSKVKKVKDNIKKEKTNETQITATKESDRVLRSAKRKSISKEEEKKEIPEEQKKDIFESSNKKNKKCHKFDMSDTITMNLSHDGEIPVLHLEEYNDSHGKNSTPISNCSSLFASSPVSKMLREDLNLSEVSRSDIEELNKTPNSKESSHWESNLSVKSVNMSSSMEKVFNTSSAGKRRRVVMKLID